GRRRRGVAPRRLRESPSVGARTMHLCTAEVPMKKFALITSLLLGAAPMAQAQTWGGDYDRRVDEGNPDNYDRHVDEGLRESARQFRERTVRLVTMDVTRSRTVDFPRSAGRFQTLRLHAVRSAGYIDFVTVRYGNGQQQHV